jgi:hypothetical protein
LLKNQIEKDKLVIENKNKDQRNSLLMRENKMILDNNDKIIIDLKKDYDKLI